MSATKSPSQSKTDRIWQQAGMTDLPKLEPDTPYREERERVRCQMAVLKGWTAWQLKEYRDAASAFHTALDLKTPDSELLAWMLRHLVERKKDYLQDPINGAWPARSLAPAPGTSGDLIEHTLPDRSQERAYNETTDAALHLLHRLLLAQPNQFPECSSLYFTYHPFIEPATEMVLAPIVKGTFQMGSPETEARRNEHETQHKVTLSNDFWMGIYQVTQQQYEAIMGENPSHFRGANRPVENVSWEDAVTYCRKLTERAWNLPEGYEFRLPTEAEWEYCCRAGTTTATAFGDTLSSEQANFNGNHPYANATKGQHLRRTSGVGSYPANAWGLCDMHGNVWEWCLDAAAWNGSVTTDTYVDRVVDPLCMVGGHRVDRGGSWHSTGGHCRSAFRSAREPRNRLDGLGFRICLARNPVAGESWEATIEIIMRHAANLLSRSDANELAKKLQPALQSAVLAAETQMGGIAGQAAVAVCRLARELPDEDVAPLLVGWLCTVVFRRAGQLLFLTLDEIRDLYKIAREDNPSSPDDVLEWIIERLTQATGGSRKDEGEDFSNRPPKF